MYGTIVSIFLVGKRRIRGVSKAISTFMKKRVEAKIESAN